MSKQFKALGLLLLFIFLGHFESYSRQITENEAIGRALISLNNKKNAKSKLVPSYKLKKVFVLNSREHPEENYLYVYRVENDGTYLIVSADDCTMPVLGYSDHKITDVDSIPDGMKFWLSEYGRQIQWIRDHQNQYLPYSQQERMVSYPNIEPLVSTRWRQDGPFNKYCPPLDGKSTLTGCMTTALAQIMKYFNYPKNGYGSISYLNWNQNLSVSFEGVEYDWENMLDVYESGYTETEANAVATLMFHVGAATETIFGPYASATKLYASKTALIKNFGYDKGMKITDRDLYEPDMFMNLLTNELVNNRPILYTGVSDPGYYPDEPSSSVGHAFILDGINSDGLVHINWGWGPGWGGYYEMSAFNPHAAPGYFVDPHEGFNNHHQILIGIQPDKGNPAPSLEIFSRSDFTISEDAETFLFPENSDIWPDTFKGIWNTSSGDGAFSFALKYVGVENDQSYIVESSEPKSTTFAIPYSTMIDAFPNMFQPQELPNGSYKVYPIYHTSQNNKWEELKTYVNNRAYIYATLKDDVVTYYNNKLYEDPIKQELDPFTYAFDPDTRTASVTGLKKRSSALSKLKIPSNVKHEGIVYTITTIADNAFKYIDTEINSLEFPETLKSIGDSAFWAAQNIKGNLIIPNSVVSIGKCAFDGCMRFDGILKFSESLTEIPDYCFKDCSNLKGNLQFPNSVRTIGICAFAGCNSLDGILSLPKGLTDIGASAFAQCENLHGSLIIPESVQTIKGYTFQNCKNLDGTLSFPKGLTEIGNSAFENCYSLQGSLILPDDIKIINTSTFKNCSGFDGFLKLPQNLEDMGYESFANCSGFTGSLIFPPSIWRICDYSFANCFGFNGDLDFSIVETLHIYPNAFEGCTGFRRLLFRCEGGSDTKLDISDKAFYGCSGFTGRLIIPNVNLGRIGVSAFEGCNSIDDVMYLGIVKPKKSAFPSDKVIRIQNSCNADYYDKEIWGSNTYIIGDANFNKVFNISDAVAITNYILGKPNASFDFVCADLNHDDRISIIDVSSLIRALFYTDLSLWNENLQNRKTHVSRSSSILCPDDFSVDPINGTNVNVYLESKDEYVALQTDIMANGDIDDVILSPELSITHQLFFSKLENGLTRVVVFSPSSRPLPKKGDPIFTILLSGSVDGDLMLTNSVLVTEDASEVYSTTGIGKNHKETEIASIDGKDIMVYGDSGNIVILNAAGCHTDIFDLSGRKIISTNLTSNTAKIAVKDGIYVINVNSKSFKLAI